MKQRGLVHIAFWFVYLMFESYIEFAWISASYASMAPIDRFILAVKAESLLLIVKIPVTYIVIYFITAIRPSFKRSVLPVVSSFVVILVATILHKLLIIRIALPYIYLDSEVTPFVFKPAFMISSLLNVVTIIGIAMALKYYRLLEKARTDAKILVKEKLEAELNFLKAQTNPHFLFNTLNNIYALARKKSDDTPEVVMKLSKLLRFMLYDARKDMITIHQEMAVLQDYIELEKIRYNERLTIDFKYHIDDETEPIAPLLLLPFVENAFKHGASELRFESFIRIRLVVRDGSLVFEVENAAEDLQVSEDNGKIGLQNVRRQLELIYPHHKLEINHNETTFAIRLQLNLRQHG
ncbi:MAG: histidine kinase [Saprospiraceae bacterium]|nr:histidine kinase [Saprospiraceae bacterium]